MSDIGADWYKRDPRRFLGGVRGLTAKQVCVYTIILDLIYEGAGTCPNDPKWIAGWIADMGPASVRKTISELMQAGKLTIENDMLSNETAKKLAKTREKTKENRRISGEKGGKKSAELRAQSHNNNDLGQALASTPVQPDKIREDIPPLSPKGEVEVLNLIPKQESEPEKPDRFDEFWNEIRPGDRKNRKADARKKWGRITKTVSPDAIIDAMKRYTASRRGQDPQFDVNPANWLERQMWEDQTEHPMDAVDLAIERDKAQAVLRAYRAKHAC